MARENDETQAGPWSRLAVRAGAEPSLPSPEEGRRLVVAFMGIKDAAVRDAIISLVERLSWSYNDLH